MNKTARNIAGYLFIALYMCYTASTTLFVHTHNYDGQFVVHSHPFVMGEGGALNHSHTLSQSLFIHFISSSLFVGMSATIALGVLFVVFAKQYKHDIEIYIRKHIVHYSLRAPPTLLHK